MRKSAGRTWPAPCKYCWNRWNRADRKHAANTCATGNRTIGNRRTVTNMDSLLHRKNRIVDLLAIGKRAVRKGMLGNDLRNRVFDAQIVFLRTVDR